MLARIQSYLLQGIDALPCEVEVDFDHGGLDKQSIVGLPDTAVKEAIDRVRTAVLNSGYSFPHRGRLLINLAPADVRKEGPLYDLPIAVGALTAFGVIPPPTAQPRRRTDPPVLTPAQQAAANGTAHFTPLDPRQYLFAGELALDGRVRPVRGVIAMAALAKSRGLRGVVVPAENAPEASVVADVEAIGVRTLTEVVGVLAGQIEAQVCPPLDVAALLGTAQASVDFAEVRGQEAVKRAITVAAAGSHNLLQL